MGIISSSLCNKYEEMGYFESEELQELREEIKKLKKENERLKNGIKHYQRGMYKIKSIAEECRNNKEWNYKDK